MNDAIRKEVRAAIEKKLTALYRAVGPLDREALGAFMDGAQDAVQEWLPPKGRAQR